jgi:excisionase family DNA binding protein
VNRLAYPIPEAAERLGIGRTSMYGLLDAGEIASVKVGKRRVVPEAALVEYLRRQLGEVPHGGSNA